MANDLSSRQWRLDTPTPYSSGPSSILQQASVWIINAEFSGYAGAGDQCILKDRTGRIVWPANGSTNLGPVRSGEIGWVNGLVLDTLSSGICIVYTR